MKKLSKHYLSYIFIYVLFCTTTSSKAQNLVLNPSFETVAGSTFPFPGYGNLVNWINPDSCTTPDLFTPAGGALLGVPANGLGNQAARTGGNYAGFIPVQVPDDNYREYISGQISTPLIAGQHYCVKFYVSLADNSPSGTNRIGMYLYNNFYQGPTSGFCSGTYTPLPFVPQLQAPATAIIDKTNWTLLQWNYTATGGEKYFIIGNFFDKNNTTTVAAGGGGGFGPPLIYYYVEDVSIIPGPPCCSNDIAPVGPFCASSTSPVTLVPDSPGGTWSGTGVNSSGVFNPSMAGAGTHVISYSLACGTGTTSIVVNPCTPPTVCDNGAGFTVSNGTSPYKWETGATSSGGGFSWSTYATNTTTVAYPGSYPLRVTDNTGQSYTVTSQASVPQCTITVCPTLTLSVASQTNVNCFGASTGSATINTTGGTGAYTYTWSPGNLSGASQTNLAAGTYTINVKDGNLCPGSTILTITQPTTALSAAISATTATGCGTSTGGATVTASGGTAGYTYSWSPSGGSTAGVTNLGAGNNNVTVTDAKGCTVTAVANITTAGGPTLSVVSQANVNCFGANTGTATVNATGGSGSYSYTWSPGNLTGASQTSLSAGTYSINVKDVNGCSGTGTISISQPTAALSATVANNPTDCGTSVGTATVTASGGSPAYTYSWSSGGTGSSVSGLAVGMYSVIVSDSKGCQTTASTFINSIGSGPSLSIASQTNLLCNGGATGSASVSASGTSAPYSYTWSPSGGNGSSASGLTAGTYIVIVQNAASCTSTIAITITQPAAINVTLSTTPASCGNSDGTATIAASGGTGGLTVLWETGSSNNSIAGLSAGSYSVTVTDANSCSSVATAVVSSSGGLSVDAGIGTTILSGESAPLNASVPNGATVVWSPSGSVGCPTCSSTIASPTVTTNYTVTATLNGCTGVDTVTIFVDILCGELYIPTAFSPNGDGQNDMLYVLGNCITNLEFVVFDRWGEKVFETSDPATGWDGTYKGKKLDPAMFAYYLNATIDEKSVSKHGNITIVK